MISPHIEETSQQKVPEMATQFYYCKIVTPIVGFCNCSMLCCTLLYVHYSFSNYLGGEERAVCFAEFVYLVSRDCCVVLLRDAMGLSAVCDCGSS